MPEEEGVHVGLAAIEEVRDEEGHSSRDGEEHHKKDRSERRCEIAGKLAPENQKGFVHDQDPADSSVM